jgi:hypothetical protein
MEAQPGGHTGPHASSSSSDPWESLKLVIERLYMSEKMKLSELVVFMKSAHRFDAGSVTILLLVP